MRAQAGWLHQRTTANNIEKVPDNATAVEVVGIDFYGAVGSVYESFAQGRAGMVVGVF